MSESSFRTRAREIEWHLYSIKLAYSTRFFRLYPWDVTPRGAPVKCQDLPRTRLVTSALRCSRRDVVFDRRTVLRYPVTGRRRHLACCQRNALVTSLVRGRSCHFTGAPLGVASHGYSRKNRVLYGRFIE